MRLLIYKLVTMGNYNSVERIPCIDDESNDLVNNILDLPNEMLLHIFTFIVSNFLDDF